MIVWKIHVNRWDCPHQAVCDPLKCGRVRRVAQVFYNPEEAIEALQRAQEIDGQLHLEVES